MFSAVAHKNLADAGIYFDEHLAQNDGRLTRGMRAAGRLPVKIVVFIVRMYYPKDPIYQGFRRDLARIILCSCCRMPSKISAMLAPYEEIIGQSWFGRRRTSGKPSSKSGDGVCGFRGSEIAADLLQSLQKSSGVSCQGPGNDENNFRPTGGAGKQNAFRVPGTPVPVCLRTEFQLGGRINDRNGKSTLFHFGTKPFENQLKSVPCLVP